MVIDVVEMDFEFIPWHEFKCDIFIEDILQKAEDMLRHNPLVDWLRIVFAGSFSWHFH